MCVSVGCDPDARAAARRLRPEAVDGRGAEPLAMCGLIVGATRHGAATRMVLKPARSCSRPIERSCALHTRTGCGCRRGHIERTTGVARGARREVHEKWASRSRSRARRTVRLDVHSIRRGATRSRTSIPTCVSFRARSRAFTASAEVLSAKWCPLADIEGSGTDESVLRAVRKLARKLARSGSAQQPKRASQQ